MKLGKKTAIAISFTVGTLMFATTAFAEVTSKSGYDQLKDSLKYTAKACTGELSNYTVDASFVVKDGSATIYSSSYLSRVDVSNKSKEDTTTTYTGSKKTESYHYTDKKSMIIKDTGSSTYYVTNFPDGTKWDIKNPFEEDRASDIEKIADALVGSLKDSVAVNVKQDGSREISGSLTNTQIPSLINALVSFQVKDSFGRNNDGINAPQLTDNIFVKNIKGNVVTDKTGLIKNVLGSGVLSGTDKNGQNHNLTFELLVKMENINSSSVKKPDLSGKKTIVQTGQSSSEKFSNPEKYIGKYSQNIVIEKDGKFVKIGEGTVTIEKINSNTVSGTYEAKYIKGYEDKNENFKFSGSPDKQSGGGGFNANITASIGSNETAKGSLYLNSTNANISFYIDGSGPMSSDSQYNRVFD
ncbi:MAG: hypothetical protein LKE46_08180 [Clostridium sp.]|jgi:hypothetical protein|uniref:hypothetical protein n=1 Tax=Clostridium sp. TaxID=1506 RepID=UPI0025C47B67|nr:hypothetical protein [Clostridium sp.]MCH3964243.1 hypothetical protein [Clostridium sp.]MCI1715423.1 hypothetical protein [Clostridium sp.]MCI1799786.1 hypothetical protein [Clostridium sp.]MCI1813606.1 hypothetical protein [Clostridium sp.]MCI1870603.1 hypothetical protein [Clostridium sp.]